ncbi:esterase-like activity of phytase family protein [Microvirga brassicacearum]|uniref:esterase-like activity of phytase family protein n=1 Tax=Microvirga brassicacearum TaxID=2580413 RepID=UPI001391ADF6|nr:esterase-like activity of phytase family protein [Microvirga brassicacearum]
MRLSRRSFLIGGGGIAAVAVAGRALAQRPQVFQEATPIAVQANPISRFSVADPDRVRFGDLAFRSGLELRSAAKEFGGFSSLWRSANGRDLVALADNAQWLRARVETTEGHLSGLAETVLTPLTLANGKRLRRTRFYDTESLAIAGNTAFVGVERRHAVIRFAWNGKAFSQGAPIGLHSSVADLADNEGLEALAIAPPGSALAGALLAVAERLPDSDQVTRGYILTGASQGEFEIARSDGFGISDMAFLPNGELLLLERRFSIFAGFTTRLRRIPAGAIRPGRLIDGAVIFESDPSQQIDNTEGLAVHREGRDIILTMISDDNFNGFQRTLLLEFALAG